MQQITCPFCSDLVSYDDSLADGLISCEACRGKFPLPPPMRPASDYPAISMYAVARRVDRKRSRPASPFAILGGVLGLVAALVGLIAIGFVLKAPSSRNDSVTKTANGDQVAAHRTETKQPRNRRATQTTKEGQAATLPLNNDSVTQLSTQTANSGQVATRPTQSNKATRAENESQAAAERMPSISEDIAVGTVAKRWLLEHYSEAPEPDPFYGERPLAKKVKLTSSGLSVHRIEYAPHFTLEVEPSGRDYPFSPVNSRSVRDGYEARICLRLKTPEGVVVLYKLGLSKGNDSGNRWVLDANETEVRSYNSHLGDCPNSWAAGRYWRDTPFPVKYRPGSLKGIVPEAPEIPWDEVIRGAKRR